MVVSITTTRARTSPNRFAGSDFFHSARMRISKKREAWGATLPAQGMGDAGEDYRLLVLPDHPTPLRVRTHTKEPVPYLLYDSRKELAKPEMYSEECAKESGIVWKEGYRLIDRLLEI